jgi:DNA-binding CsgD family transcriptional regulator/PAS domain-containing protein
MPPSIEAAVAGGREGERRRRGMQVNPSGEQIEKVLDLIYDAAAENELWRDVLTAIADLTNSQGGILFGQSLTAQQIYFDFNGRLDEECNRAYQERHMQNPWSEYMEHQPVGRLVLSDEAIELSKLRATGFYHEVLRPQNITHNGMMALAARRDFRAAFNICRGASQGQFEANEHRLLEWLSPHMLRSIALGFRIDGYLAMQHAAFSLLDQLADGIIILDRRSLPLFANAAARRLEAEGALRLRQPITITSLAHSQRLSELLRDALSGAPGGTMSFPRNADGQLLTILVSSIRSKDFGRLSDAGFKDAAVLVFIIDPANRRSIPLGQIMDAYGLTQAEARVALAASSGNTIGETAQLLKLSPNTIKTHLRRVFAKTATGRQTELAGLIAAVGSVRLPGQDNE